MNAQANERAALAAGIYWGAIWGLYEATVGWLVHFLPRVPGTASLVMVPFAVFCLDRALRHGGGALRAVLYAALTAAAIKLVDFCLPLRALHAVINPALSILLQGLAFLAVARWFGLARRLPSLPVAALGALVFSTGWRLAFLLYSAALAGLWSVGMLRESMHTIWSFLMRDALLGAVAVVVVMGLVHRRKLAGAAARPAPGRLAVVIVLVLAVGAEITVRLVG